MALDLSAVGAKTAVYDYPYDWKILATYALGIGAKKDELAYVYEGQGAEGVPHLRGGALKFALMGEMHGKTQGSLASILHGGQSVRIHKKILRRRRRTTATLDGIYDMKKMAQAIVKTQTEINGELIFETESSIISAGKVAGWCSSPSKKSLTSPTG
ncbi:MAG: hypothetical protein R3B07_12885 [Polyangiaceae bacterium]